jgi:hypothetical protein
MGREKDNAKIKRRNRNLKGKMERERIKCMQKGEK